MQINIHAYATMSCTRDSHSNVSNSSVYIRTEFSLIQRFTFNRANTEDKDLIRR